MDHLPHLAYHKYHYHTASSINATHNRPARRDPLPGARPMGPLCWNRLTSRRHCQLYRLNWWPSLAANPANFAALRQIASAHRGWYHLTPHRLSRCLDPLQERRSHLQVNLRYRLQLQNSTFLHRSAYRLRTRSHHRKLHTRDFHQEIGPRHHSPHRRLQSAIFQCHSD